MTGRAIALFATLGFGGCPTAAASPPPSRPANAKEFTFFPATASAGAAVAPHGSRVAAGPSLGLEVFPAAWHRLAFTAAELRLQLYSRCRTGPSGRQCGITGDFFVGSRVGVVVAADEHRRHLLTLGCGVGWGSVGQGRGGRAPSRTGVVLAPGLRYTFGHIVGLELQALVPAYDQRGPYAPALTINLIGLPLLLLALR
ncbi:MAG: hypothetical protein AAF721_36045 [Myxococcota bacterium]